jgi:hypothetical protein
VLDVAFSEAAAVVVLLTGDDEAKLRDHLILPDDQDYERFLTSQPRQNVLLEAGLAFGRHPERTVLVQVGDIRPISDLAGRYIVRLDNSMGKRQILADRLRVAGCAVDTTGTDWHSAGDFEAAAKARKKGVYPSSSDLSDPAVRIMRELATAANMEAAKRDLQLSLSMDAARFSYHVEELIRHNFVANSPGEAGEGRLVLLLPGRDYLVTQKSYAENT